MMEIKDGKEVVKGGKEERRYRCGKINEIREYGYINNALHQIPFSKQEQHPNISITPPQKVPGG